MSDWESIKARLAVDADEGEKEWRSAGAHRQAADIRAALERISDLENACMVHHDEMVRIRAERNAALVHGPEDMIRALEAAEAKLARCAKLADHQIPFYAYGDNEAGCDMSHRLEQILMAAKGE